MSNNQIVSKPHSDGVGKVEIVSDSHHQSDPQDQGTQIHLPGAREQEKVGIGEVWFTIKSSSIT